MDDLIIGSHVSFNKNSGLMGSVLEAISYGANAFMFYTGAPQNTTRVPIDKAQTKEAYHLMKANSMELENVVVHAPYIINIANDGMNYMFAKEFLKQEIARCEQLGVKKLILHPGSHVSLGEEKGLDNIIMALNEILTSDQKVIICLETMSGKGSECAYNFDHIKYIIDNVALKSKIAICLDTCHLHDSGYDLSNFDDILDEIKSKIGLDKIACIHVNDSKNDRGIKKDRHENLGFGKIGFDNLLKVIYHPLLVNVPKILETPYVSKLKDDKDRAYPPYKHEISMIRRKEFNHNLLEEIRNFYQE